MSCTLATHLKIQIQWIRSATIYSSANCEYRAVTEDRSPNADDSVNLRSRLITESLLSHLELSNIASWPCWRFLGISPVTTLFTPNPVTTTEAPGDTYEDKTGLSEIKYPSVGSIAWNIERGDVLTTPCLFHHTTQIVYILYSHLWPTARSPIIRLTCCITRCLVKVPEQIDRFKGITIHAWQADRSHKSCECELSVGFAFINYEHATGSTLQDAPDSNLQNRQK